MQMNSPLNNFISLHIKFNNCTIETLLFLKLVEIIIIVIINCQV